jgi:hypothetical protein
MVLDRMNNQRDRTTLVLKMLCIVGFLCQGIARADPRGFLETIHHHNTLTSTVTENGDQDPAGVIVAPVSAGKIQKDDVLVTNNSDIKDMQGLAKTIVGYRPSTKTTYMFANLPRAYPECPGGIGLSAAITMLKTGWVIVGSAPSTDGTTTTKGPGCILVLDPNGKIAAAWSGPNINFELVDSRTSAILFATMSGFDVPPLSVVDPATGLPVVKNEGTVLRMELRIPEGGMPVLERQVVIGSGFAERADLDNFMLGPTGLALAPDKTLYVTDEINNSINAIPNAVTRSDSAGIGQMVTKGGLLSWPLGMVLSPQGHLLVCNGKDGRLVEVDPVARKQVYGQWINTNQQQSPPGNGNLFGIAMTPDGTGYYYVADDTDTLMLGSP